MSYFLLGVEGVLTFISPCLLPMLPIYLAYISGQVDQENSASQVKRPFFVQALLFVLGFTLIFVLMSLFVNTLGRFVLINRTLIHWIAGAFMILIGFDYFLGNPLMNRVRVRSQATFNHTSAFVLGMVFSISWTPCVGTFLASALSYAATSDSYIESVALLLSYSLGLGIPFILSALLIEELQSVIQWIKQHYDVIHKVSGVFLIAFGVFTITGWLETLLIYLS
ncbi:cytochrome c biogenesis CcdA family protein [Aerococcaceae bacterium WGS1372]